MPHRVHQSHALAGWWSRPLLWDSWWRRLESGTQALLFDLAHSRVHCRGVSYWEWLLYDWNFSSRTSLQFKVVPNAKQKICNFCLLGISWWRGRRVLDKTSLCHSRSCSPILAYTVAVRDWRLDCMGIFAKYCKTKKKCSSDAIFVYNFQALWRQVTMGVELSHSWSWGMSQSYCNYAQ